MLILYHRNISKKIIIKYISKLSTQAVVFVLRLLKKYQHGESCQGHSFWQGRAGRLDDVDKLRDFIAQLIGFCFCNDVYTTISQVEKSRG